MESELKLKRENFTRVDLDQYHHYFSFSVPGFEICLEPCAGGFDVAIYNEHKELLGPRQCTNSDGYLESAGVIFGDRRDEEWNKVLEIANKMLAEHKPSGNELITGEEILALFTRAKVITMHQALRATLEGGVFLITPMNLKSGYCVVLTIMETSGSQPAARTVVFSVGAYGEPVDPADAERLAKAVLQEYTALGNLHSKRMTHFMKKVKM